MKNYAFFFALFFSGGISYSQTPTKGIIKLFYELKSVDVYLDEIYIGRNPVMIENVDLGTHYLKVLKDSVQIYSDLVLVTSALPAVVLIKDNEEVQKKLFNSKTTQQAEYKSRRIEIMVSKKYVTETVGEANTNEYNGYCSYSNYSNTKFSSVSTTKEITDWKIVMGRTNSISDIQLAHYADMKPLEATIHMKLKRLKADSAANSEENEEHRHLGIGACAVSSLLLGVASFINTDNTQTNQNVSPMPVVTTLGLSGCVLGVFGYLSLIKQDNQIDIPEHFISLQEALEAADLYNKKLKIELGLPVTYEP